MGSYVPPFTVSAKAVSMVDEAKKQYPEADDIVNILVDGKKGPFGKMEYIMSAVVIKYVSPAAQ